jgi:hypothetical protein
MVSEIQKEKLFVREKSTSTDLDAPLNRLFFAIFTHFRIIQSNSTNRTEQNKAPLLTNNQHVAFQNHPISQNNRTSSQKLILIDDKDLHTK